MLYTYDFRMPEPEWKPILLSAPKNMYKDLWNQVVLVKNNQIWGMNDYDYVFSIDNLNLVNDESVDEEMNKSEDSLDIGGLFENG